MRTPANTMVMYVPNNLLCFRIKIRLNLYRRIIRK